MDAAEILEKTADELERSGHLKYDLGTVTGPKCLNGAMNFVETGHTSYTTEVSEERCHAVDSLFAYLNLTLTEREDCGCAICAWRRTLDPVVPKMDELANWNNEDQRDPGEIIDACRHTAKVLRGN